MSEESIDLCAGAGGWDVAARALGLDPLGIEWDGQACLTRDAAGLRTLCADVSKLDPREFAPVRVVIASPPCQAFSPAGKGEGRAVLPLLIDAAWRHLEGKPPSADGLDEICEDERAHLVLEPLRWALALRPEAIACEQVESVLPLWEAFGQILRTVGYLTWAGVISAETYGTPQTRRRAILMCSRSRQPREPERTHARYVTPRKVERQTESLFEAPEPERIVLPEDRGLEPWVSMAEALGWDGGEVAGFPRRADRANGSVEVNGPDYRSRDFRDASEPAFTVTEKARSAIRLRFSNQENATVRGVDEPASTVLFGHRINDVRWEVVATGSTRGGERPEGLARPATDPAPTITSRADQLEQHKENGQDEPGRFEQRRGENAVRVSVEEAAVLQGMPADYPWRGTKTAKFAQIGNLIPPQMALAVLRELLG